MCVYAIDLATFKNAMSVNRDLIKEIVSKN